MRSSPMVLLMQVENISSSIGVIWSSFSHLEALGLLHSPYTFVIKCTSSVRLNEKSPSEAFGLQVRPY
jgi:hypothetical protein